MMKANQKVLSTVLKTSQISQIELHRILDTCMDANLRSTLESQLKEFRSIETEAYTLALQRGLELPELPPGNRFFRDRFVRMKLNGHHTDSRIADILIRRNTKDMILGLKKQHQLAGMDHQIRILSQKLLDCETAHIQQMKGFL